MSVHEISDGSDTIDGVCEPVEDNSLMPLSHGHLKPGPIRVRPGLTPSHALTVSGSNPRSTRVNNPSSTLVTSRVEPGYKRVKDGGMQTDLER